MKTIKASTDLPSERKARGAFFTPPELAGFLSRWAIRRASDRVFEPSCGEAAFLLSAAERLQSLGTATPVLCGMDIHEASVRHARRVLASGGAKASIQTDDFFAAVPPEEKFDAVIGNPPYVRYQSFSGDARVRALEAAFKQGVRLTGLASSWAAFTVHASAFLKPSGRLALVLPAELLSVNYAAEIRRFLLKRFSSVRLVLFEDLVFPGVLEEVVLLLAEGSGGADHFEVLQAKNAADLRKAGEIEWTGYSPRADEKWTSALLPSDSLAVYRELTAGPGFEVMLDWGETYLGAVTGNNDYFALSRSQIRELRLREADLEKISPPGSRHLRGPALTSAGWEHLAANGHPCYLFAPSDRPSAAAERYIEKGERAGIHKAYKCRVRTPWWKVPMVPKPDFFLSYMNYKTPRLTRNVADVHLLNSLYGIRLHASRRRVGRDSLHVASMNSVSLLGAEIVGRSYGGGMLKHEPKEADMLPMPSLEILREAETKLKPLHQKISLLLRGGDIAPAVDLVDRVLLQGMMKATPRQIAQLRKARAMLFQRRVARGKGQNGAH
jgi:adenine-specific DNA methylase